jgi:pimeloyl-[acyl-carrier protein] methyl ester esterase
MSQYNWILVRGLSRQTKHWGPFPETLANTTGDNVFTLELPGVGTKNDIPAKTSIRENVEHLRKELEGLKKENSGDWGIIAVSLGGMIAMEWCSVYPEDFKHMVVLNSSAGNLSSPFKRLQPEAIKTIAGLFFKNDLEHRERKVLELTTNIVEINDDLVKRWSDINRERPISRESFLRQLFAGAKFRVPKSVGPKALVVISKADKLCNPSCPMKLADHLSANSVFHETAGHDIALDAPNWLANEINKFTKP